MFETNYKMNGVLEIVLIPKIMTHWKNIFKVTKLSRLSYGKYILPFYVIFLIKWQTGFLVGNFFVSSKFSSNFCAGDKGPIHGTID